MLPVYTHGNKSNLLCISIQILGCENEAAQKLYECAGDRNVTRTLQLQRFFYKQKTLNTEGV